MLVSLACRYFMCNDDAEHFGIVHVRVLEECRQFTSTSIFRVLLKQTDLVKMETQIDSRNTQGAQSNAIVVQVNMF